MKIGLMHLAQRESVDGLVESVRRAEAEGFASLWMPNVFALDAITALGVAGRESDRIELGTAVVPIQPRHPFAMAQQALTTAAASGGRFALGIGLSHKVVIEDMFGLSFDRPARHMREYLEAMSPLLRGERTNFDGDVYRVSGSVRVPDAGVVPVLVAALGSAMLRVAGSHAQGTITWMTGIRTLESHIGPCLREAARDAGRPEPRVVAGVPVALTTDIDAAQKRVGEVLSMYGSLPSYRAMLDREGAASPADVALLGDEATLRAGIERHREVGVTDFTASIIPVGPGSRERTREFLRDLL